MAKLASDLQTALALRLGENSAPNDSNEKARRLSYFNEAYRDVMRRNYWWFTETNSTFSSIADQASYSTTDGVPSNLRAILELRVSNTLYHKIEQKEGLDALTLPYNNAVESYFIFAGSIYFVPPIAATGTNNVAIKYYKYHTELTSDSSSILIPDIYSDVLVSYAYGRISQKNGKRGSASDGFEEYKEIIQLMQEEQNRYMYALITNTNDPEITGVYE